MRFKNRQRGSEMPDLNLVPMMDVVMVILIFFIILSMNASNQKSVNVTLPSAEGGVTDVKDPDPLIVGLNTQGQILLDNKPASDSQLSQAIQVYLNKNPKGAVILKADKAVAYEKVARLLATMRDFGGDRVSLAIDG